MEGFVARDSPVRRRTVSGPPAGVRNSRVGGRVGVTEVTTKEETMIRPECLVG